MSSKTVPGMIPVWGVKFADADAGADTSTIEPNKSAIVVAKRVKGRVDTAISVSLFKNQK